MSMKKFQSGTKLVLPVLAVVAVTMTTAGRTCPLRTALFSYHNFGFTLALAFSGSTSNISFRYLQKGRNSYTNPQRIRPYRKKLALHHHRQPQLERWLVPSSHRHGGVGFRVNINARPFQYKLNAAMRRPPGDFLDYNFLLVDEATDKNNNTTNSNQDQVNDDLDDSEKNDINVTNSNTKEENDHRNENNSNSEKVNFLSSEKNLPTNLQNMNFKMPNVTDLIPNSMNFNSNTTATNSNNNNNNMNTTMNVLRGVVQVPQVSLPEMNMPPLPNVKNISLPNVNLNVASFNVSLPDVKFMNNVTMMKLPNMSKPNLPDLPDLPDINIRLPKPTRKYDKQSQINDNLYNSGAGENIIDVTATEDEEYNNKNSNNNNKNPLLLFGVFQELQLELDVTKYKFPSWKQQRQPQPPPPIDIDTRSNKKDMMLFNIDKGWVGSQQSWTPPPNVLLNALTSSICKVTGKDTYQFGDLTRYIDSKAKLAVQGIQNDIRDLSVQVDDAIQGKITSLAMMQQQKEFSITDVSRTLVKKVASGDYQLSDITFLCKILIALGVADFTPVAGILPVRLLIELFGYSTAIDLGERFATALIKELDKRLQMNEEEGKGSEGGKDVPFDKQLLSDKGPQMNEEETGGIGGEKDVRPEKNLLRAEERSYEAGDLTRQAILEYTGKDSYQIGDVVSKKGLSSTDSVDVLKELEECLAMERKLIEKLNKIKT